jgi:hypothetical protein
MVVAKEDLGVVVGPAVVAPERKKRRERRSEKKLFEAVCDVLEGRFRVL